ncbi:MAG: glycosyltransferase family 4 protein [Alphaproteobacteria bacterium]|nr:glycosyltransferase family 4 protein [Alphaproteobacteria bacterium]
MIRSNFSRGLSTVAGRTSDAEAVLQVTVFATFRVGGPQVRFAALANHLGRSFRHIIVAMDNQFDCKSLLDPSLDITFRSFDIDKAKIFANLRMFRKFLGGIKPDVLVTHNWGSIEWALANWPGLVRHIHIEDGFGPEEAARQLPRRALARRALLGRSQVVVASHKLEQIATGIWKLDPHIVHFVPNGIDCERFAAGAEPIVPAGAPTIGTVAALRREKNLPRLIEAFRTLRENMPCRLVIAGDGPERSILEEQVERLGLGEDVIFLGHRTDTERVYASLSIYVLSSDTEQMPLSVIEAMAAGLPVVSTDVGDVREMVSAGNREFIRGDDAETLALNLGTLLESRQAEHIGAHNQIKAREDFSQVKMFSAYEALLRGAVI